MRTLLACLLLCAACGGDDTPAKNDAATTDTGGGNIDSSGNGDTMGALPSCQDYCTAIQANCTAALQQYANMQNCLDSCANFMVGALSDTSGNTVGCRLYHAQQSAGGGASTHCRHAGPGGGGMCGPTICAGFCAIAPNECPTQWPAGTCSTACAAENVAGNYSTASAGDSIECRLYHLTMAATDPGGHCGHTTPQNSTACN